MDQQGLTKPILDAGRGLEVAERVRARRFELQIGLRYRAGGEGYWHRGICKNISSSGLLFHGEDWTEPNTPLEISLVLPKQMTVERNAEVICRGTVTRSERRGSNGNGTLIATRISHYRFVRP